MRLASGVDHTSPPLPEIKSGSRRRRRWRRWITMAAVLIIAAAGVTEWQFGGRKALPLAIATARKGAIAHTVTALGVIEPVRFVDVGAQVEGQVIKMPVTLGQFVHKGELIAEIDPTQYAALVGEDQAEIANLDAQIKQWQAKTALAKWTYETDQKLARQNFTAQLTFRQSQANYEVDSATIASLRAQVLKARSTLTADRANLRYTRITAPISGFLASPTSAIYGDTWSKLDIVHRGQILNNKQSAPLLLRIVDVNRMKVRAQVSEADIARLKPGMEVYFTTLGRPHHRIYSKLGAIELTPELINGAIFYDAIFTVPNPGHVLLPQMTAQVTFVVDKAKNAVIVPLAALASTQAQNGVSLPGCPPSAGKPAAGGTRDCVLTMQDGRSVATPVTVGVTNEVNAQILNSVVAGEQVVIGGSGSPAAGPAGRHKGGGRGGGHGGLR